MNADNNSSPERHGNLIADVYGIIYKRKRELTLVCAVLVLAFA